MSTFDPSDFRRWAYAVARDLLAAAPASKWELDDLAQEALIVMWQAAPKWANDGRASLATYVTASARRRMLELLYRGRPALGEGDNRRTHGSRDTAQHLSVELEVELVDKGARPMPAALTEQPADLETADVVARVRAAVACLPEKERLAVTAVDLLGMGAQEAAPIVGVVPDHVRNLRSRARKRLREQLADLKEAA